MKIKKLALALGTVMMMSVFGMSASALTVSSGNTELETSTTDETLLRLTNAGTKYTIGKGKSMVGIKTLLVEANTELIIDGGQVFLENANIVVSGKLTIKNGGVLNGSVNGGSFKEGTTTVDLNTRSKLYFSGNAASKVPTLTNIVYSGVYFNTYDDTNHQIENADAVKVTYNGATVTADTKLSYSSKLVFTASDNTKWEFKKWAPGDSTSKSYETTVADLCERYVTAVFKKATPKAESVKTPAAATPAAVNGPMTIQLKKTSFTANGSKAVKPAIKEVKVNGKKIAKKYYKVSYKNNKKAGKAQVIVTGKGKYKAFRATVDFTIKPAKAKFSKVKASKNAITASWKKQNGVVGYEVQYSTNRKFTDAKSVYTTGYRATKTTIKNLTSKTKVYVRVRAAVAVDNRNVVFGNWSSVKKVTVK